MKIRFGYTVARCFRFDHNIQIKNSYSHNHQKQIGQLKSRTMEQIIVVGKGRILDTHWTI